MYCKLVGIFSHFYSCTILVNSIYLVNSCELNSRFLLHLVRLHHFNFGEFVYRAQVQTGSRISHYFNILQREFPDFDMKVLAFLFHKKSSELFFLILLSCRIYLFKVWLKCSRKDKDKHCCK